MMKIKVLLLILIIMIAGCSSSRKLIKSPNIYISSNYPATMNQDLFAKIIYVTDRMPIIKNKKLTYNSKRSSAVSYGISKVSFIGPNNWNSLKLNCEIKNRKKRIRLHLNQIKQVGQFPHTPVPFSMQGKKIIESKEESLRYKLHNKKLTQLIQKYLFKYKTDQVLLFIHGFDTTFKESLFDLSEVWHFTGRESLPILYSWPAGYGGLFGYFTDRESGEFSIFHLKEFLKLLKNVKEIKTINILAHSRGTDIMTSALRELFIASKAGGRNPKIEFKIKNLFLAAPDLNFDVVRQRLIAEKFGLSFGQINVYTNAEDGALGFAQDLMYGTRFGRLKKSDMTKNDNLIFKSIKNVNFINVIGTTGFFKHSYYRKHPGALSDIIQVIRKSSVVGSKERPLKHKYGNFWSLNRDYLLND